MPDFTTKFERYNGIPVHINIQYNLVEYIREEAWASNRIFFSIRPDCLDDPNGPTTLPKSQSKFEVYRDYCLESESESEYAATEVTPIYGVNMWKCLLGVKDMLSKYKERSKDYEGNREYVTGILYYKNLHIRDEITYCESNMEVFTDEWWVWLEEKLSKVQNFSVSNN